MVHLFVVGLAVLRGDADLPAANELNVDGAGLLLATSVFTESA